MSAGSTIIKSIVVIGLMAGVGASIKDYRSVNATYQGDIKQTAQLKRQYAQDKKKKPTVKRVTTNYQKAMKCANAYMKASDAYHDATKRSDQNKYYHQMQNLSADDVSGPMVSSLIKGWHGTVEYGGQDADGRVLVAFKYMDGSNKVMQMTTCYYHPDTNQLTGFTTYMSKAGADVNRQTLRN